jgi:hypothetical protein
VAEAQTSSKKAGLTRGKAVLIAVLAIVLVAVLYVQFSSSREMPSSESVRYRPPGRATMAPTAAVPARSTGASAGTTAIQAPLGNEKVGTPIIDESRWKSPALATVIAHDPFALPSAFPQPTRKVSGDKGAGAEGLIAAAAADDAKKLAETVEKLRMQLEELKQRGVTVILREGDQYAAWIGERMVHVGDEINGFTVTAIDLDGVHIETKDSP